MGGSLRIVTAFLLILLLGLHWALLQTLAWTGKWGQSRMALS